MDEAALLSGLIGDIYDAALDSSLWPAVLGQARQFVGGSAASLYAKDAVSKSGNVFYEDGGIDARYRRLYFEKYVKLDPSTVGHFFAEVGQPVATADFIDYDEFLETRFYREWARPQRLVDHITVTLDRSATSVALFGVFRHERDGVADDAARRRIRLLAPHVRRAVLIGRVIDLKTAEAATFADAFDGLSAGMLLVDGQGRIVHANAAAHSLLAAGDPLRVSDGRLVAADPEIDRTLRDIFASADQGDAAIGVNGIAVSLGDCDGEGYVAHVLPLTSGIRRRAGRSYAATAALFVHKATLQIPSPPEAIAKHYRLTPTELRVLLAIVEVGGVPEVAEALGVAETTVKTHLGRLYEKTGTARQADLVKLVAGFSSPLIG
jgi:DNA-binding CsgD family transcriptional regulator/PAS domain-containing protein